MALLTKKEFTALCGIKTNRLSVEIERGKVILGDNDMVDPDNETNVAFRERVQSKQAAKNEQISRSETYVEPGGDDEDGINPLTVSDKRYKHFLAQKTEKAVELADLEIAKKRGVVVPSELIKPLFSQHNQSIITEFKNLMDSALRVVGKECDLTVEQAARIKGDWIAGLNEAMDRAKKATAKGIANIVENYQEAK